MKQNLKRCINRKITVEDMLDILRDSVEKFNKYRKLESIDYTTFWNNKNSLTQNLIRAEQN